MVEFNLEELKSDPKFNEFVNSIIAKKEEKFKQSQDATVAEWSKSLQDTQAEIAKKQAELEALQNEARLKAENAASLEKELSATKMQALQQATRNRVIEIAASRHPKNISHIADLVTSRVQYDDDGKLKVGDQPLSDYIDSLVNDPQTAYLFGSDTKPGTGVPNPEPPKPTVDGREQIAKLMGIQPNA